MAHFGPVTRPTETQATPIKIRVTSQYNTCVFGLCKEIWRKPTYACEEYANSTQKGLQQNQMLRPLDLQTWLKGPVFLVRSQTDDVRSRDCSTFVSVWFWKRVVEIKCSLTNTNFWPITQEGAGGLKLPTKWRTFRHATATISADIGVVEALTAPVLNLNHKKCFTSRFKSTESVWQLKQN